MKPIEQTRVVVVDDHPLYRSGVVQTINAIRDFCVVAEGSTAGEAVELCRKEVPEIVLLDINMPGSGLMAAREIAALCPATRIVMLTVSEDDDDVQQSFRIGARAYILKGVDAESLASILQSVDAGDVYVPPRLASRILSDIGSSPRSPKDDIIGNLTERERQILEGVARGDSNKEIAFTLEIAEKTVKHYMTNILQKLHARNRVEAALLARDAGLGDRSGR